MVAAELSRLSVVLSAPACALYPTSCTLPPVRPRLGRLRLVTWPRPTSALCVKVATRERPHEGALRVEGGKNELDGLWCSKSLLGEFADVFIDDTGLEGGDPHAAMADLAGMAQLSRDRFRSALTLFTQESELGVIMTVIEKMKVGAATRCDASLPELVERRSKMVHDLAVGDFMIWPSGWHVSRQAPAATSSAARSTCAHGCG